MQKNCDRTILYSLIIEVSDSKENSRNNLEARNNVSITIEDALRPPIFFFLFFNFTILSRDNLALCLVKQKIADGAEICWSAGCKRHYHSLELV